MAASTELPQERCFDQVWVINLKRRPDRLARFWAEIEKANWPFRRPRVFEAIDGNKVGVPKFWQTGGGSYGCLRSHLNILERDEIVLNWHPTWTGFVLERSAAVTAAAWAPVPGVTNNAVRLPKAGPPAFFRLRQE